MRIVQLANLVTPTSGGIRIVMETLGEGYAARGHVRHVIVPGRHPTRTRVHGGLRFELPSALLPRSGGYRLLLRRAPVEAALNHLAPDAVEVSDRYTLGWVADWARRRGVRSTLVVHEHLERTLATWLPFGAAWLAERLSRPSTTFDTVVCPSRWTTATLPPGIGARIVPFGVDHALFHPRRPPPPSPPVRLLYVGRLSREKRPDLALGTLTELRHRGVSAQLRIVGNGPLRKRLERSARDLPVRFDGHLARGHVAAAMSDADVLLSLCPIEAFGMAALEALASGTPVVSVWAGAVPELLEPTAGIGAVAPPRSPALADAVTEVLSAPRVERTHLAQQHALAFTWARTVRSMLAVHAGTPGLEVAV